MDEPPRNALESPGEQRYVTQLDYDPVTVCDKRAVVVGGTSGIGEAISLAFAAEGATVTATSRDPEKVEDTANTLDEYGGNPIQRTCDVTDRNSLEWLCEAVIDAYGGIDVLVLSQGAIGRHTLRETPESEWERVTDVALDGVYRAVQVFADALAEEGGSVVAISSLTARLAMANVPAYAAAKGGVESFVRAAAKELAPAVRVNAIAPGFVLTPQNEDTYAEGTEKRTAIHDRTPLGRVGERAEIAGAAVYLASDAASYTTGEVLTVDGGFADSAL